MKTKNKGLLLKLQKAKGLKRAGGLLLYLLCAFFLSGVALEEELFPFGAAFCAGVPLPVLLPACIGAAIGAFVFCKELSTLKYVGAVFLLFVVRTGINGKIKPDKRLYLYPAIAFFCLLISSLSVLLTTRGSAVDFILQISDALIAGASACFFYRAVTVLKQSKNKLAASSLDTAALLLTASLLLAGLNILQLKGYSFARVLAYYLIMMFCLAGKEGAGAMAGVGCGFIFGLSNQMPHLMYALPLGGLIGGICAESGNVAVGIGFAVSYILAFLLKGNADTALPALTEVALSCILFMFTQKKAVNGILSWLTPFSRDVYADESRLLISRHLKQSARAVYDMATSVKAVCRHLSQKDYTDFMLMIPEVKDGVCAGCIKYDFCWNRMNAQTKAAFAECVETVSSFQNMTPGGLPHQLRIVCSNKEALCDTFERVFCEFSAHNMARGEIFHAKLNAASQFTCAAAVIEDAAQQVLSLGKSDVRLSTLFRDCLHENGFDFAALTVSINEAGRCTAQIFCNRLPEHPNFNRLLQSLTEKTNLQFMTPAIEEYKPGGATLCLCEQTSFTVEFDKLSKIGAGERFCGDTCEGFYDGRGNFFCILSDGMGTGTRAALDSVMTCSLMARLLRSGFSMDTAFYAVNTALLVKSADETLATLDILQIDLYTGEVKLYKAGGSFSVLRKGNKTVIAERASMPLGILKETKVNQAQTVLNAGDAVLILSDGAGQLKPQFFKNMFESLKQASAGEYCRAVINGATQNATVGKADDITAACVILK